MTIPVIYRKWFLERLLRELEEKKKDREVAKNNSPDFSSLSKFERKLGMT